MVFVWRDEDEQADIVTLGDLTLLNTHTMLQHQQSIGNKHYQV
jgi:hypothetical protein